MLISPTERPPISLLGTTSSIPERFGVDILFFSPVFKTVGVQRKEISDLVASLSDGRVTREVIDMKALDVGIWLIEGRPQWTRDGELLGSRTPFTVDSFYGVLLSLQSQGFWTARTDNVNETVGWLRHLERWLGKDKHNGLVGRPNARSILGGEASTRDWQIHLMQSLPGMGYERARETVRFYDGLPIRLKDGVDLTDVPGVGKVTAERVRKVLE